MINEKNLTPELLEKAKYATSSVALIALAQENGISLTAEEAANYYSQLHPEIGAISDEELDNVSGGECRGGAAAVKYLGEFDLDFCPENYRCSWCSKPMRFHGDGSHCTQIVLKCSTCKNFVEYHCIKKTH